MENQSDHNSRRKSAPRLLTVWIVALTVVTAFCLLLPSVATATTTYYPSVGNGGTLVSGSQGIGEGADCTSGSPIVTFRSGTTLPANVGDGDGLTINGSVEGYILTRDSATQVTLQSNCSSTYSDEDFQIDRAYASISAWESARQRDLTAATE